MQKWHSPALICEGRRVCSVATLQCFPGFSACQFFILGGIGGSMAGTGTSRRMAAHKGQLNTVFAILVLIVALYMLYQSLQVLSF